VAADVWSVTSWNELRRDGLAAEEEAFLNPGTPARTPFVAAQLAGATGPVVAVSDYMKAVPDQIRQFLPNEFASLGADGFGFSDTRQAARRFFKNDTHSIVVKTLQLLAAKGEVDAQAPAQAIEKYRLLDVNAGTTGGAGGDA
ncbi:transketolase-like TK C-terminal-containing protein, partial [Arthrobacter cavernae]|nr:pyruvate dehydrogenase (acetyl-transferring), homodimeric type [Arthrobacter cavernae]